MKYSLIIYFSISIVFASAQDFKQLKREDYPKRHIKTYEAGDSIKRALTNSAVDTIILLYKTRRYALNQLPDHTDNHRSSFLVWLKDKQE